MLVSVATGGDMRAKTGPGQLRVDCQGLQASYDSGGGCLHRSASAQLGNRPGRVLAIVEMP
jgi:hypothetical protein